MHNHIGNISSIPFGLCMRLLFLLLSLISVWPNHITLPFPVIIIPLPTSPSLLFSFLKSKPGFESMTLDFPETPVHKIDLISQDCKEQSATLAKVAEKGDLLLNRRAKGSGSRLKRRSCQGSGSGDFHHLVIVLLCLLAWMAPEWLCTSPPKSLNPRRGFPYADPLPWEWGGGAEIPSGLYWMGIRQFPRRKEVSFCLPEIKGWIQWPKRTGVHSRLTSGFSWGREKEYLDFQEGDGHLVGPNEGLTQDPPGTSSSTCCHTDSWPSINSRLIPLLNLEH